MQQGNKELANKAMSGVTAELMKTDKTFTAQQKPCSFSLSHTQLTVWWNVKITTGECILQCLFIFCLPDSLLLFFNSCALETINSLF